MAIQVILSIGLEGVPLSFAESSPVRKQPPSSVSETTVPSDSADSIGLGVTAGPLVGAGVDGRIHYGGEVALWLTTQRSVLGGFDVGVTNRSIYAELQWAWEIRAARDIGVILGLSGGIVKLHGNRDALGGQGTFWLCGFFQLPVPLIPFARATYIDRSTEGIFGVMLKLGVPFFLR
jgi:hypothetical protein